jgi:hypothetical protein
MPDWPRGIGRRLLAGGPSPRSTAALHVGSRVHRVEGGEHGRRRRNGPWKEAAVSERRAASAKVMAGGLEGRRGGAEVLIVENAGCR